MDNLAQSNLQESLGALSRSVSPGTQLLQAPSSLSPVQGAGKALVSHWSFSPSPLWPAGPSPALSCPEPGRASHRMAKETLGLVLLPHMLLVPLCHRSSSV